MKIKKLHTFFIILTILISYFSLSIFIPAHITEMNKNHDMGQTKENCPFVFGENILCNISYKKTTDLINLNYLNFNNLFANSFLMKIILLTFYFSLFYLFKIFYLKNQKEYKIPIILTHLFSKGILNTKVY